MTSTHVLKYDGGSFTSEIGSRKQIDFFARTLRRFNGEKPWALTLVPLHGRDYGEMLRSNVEATEFLQAGGSADAMTIEIRRPGGRQWGVESVWGVVGHPVDGAGPLDVPIKLPHSTQMISKSEVFDADEAADLFFTYYQTGEIPSTYTLRPVNGWTADNVRVDLRQEV